MSYDIDSLISALLPEEGREKQASEAPVTVAEPTVADELREVLLTKSASEAVSDAAEMGRALATRLLSKQASEAPVSTGNEALDAIAVGIEKEASDQPNVAAADNSALAAEQQSVNVAAEQSGGTVEQQTEETIKKGLETPSAVATSEDVVRRVEDKAEDSNMLKAAALSALVESGEDFYDAASAVYMADHELQKEAAYAQLIEEGLSFEEATSLVKAASEMTDEVDEEVEKKAALDELLTEGVPFDEAVDLVKQASALGAVKGAAGKVISGVKSEGSKISGDFKAYRGISKANPKLGKKVGKDLLKNTAKRNTNSLTAVGGLAAGGAAGSMTKEAAFSAMLEAGYTFDQALAAIQA